jgi:hypothetical protein
MAKRKTIVTVDEKVVEQARLLGMDNFPAVVNEALTVHVERLARGAALDELLNDWEHKFGSMSEAAAEARAGVR